MSESKCSANESINKKFTKVFNYFEKLLSHCMWVSNKFVN